jgi:3-deoxy-manno-octulosonate cytidylyltransferase (CMP-KDO synthetase)
MPPLCSIGCNIRVHPRLATADGSVLTPEGEANCHLSRSYGAPEHGGYALNDTLIAIPSRLKATRLPDKPLADIHGVPMIVHVWRRAVEAGVGRVIVATDSDAIAQVIATAGGEAVMTRDTHTTGSDRIHEALTQIDPAGRIKFIVNLQGDLPTLEPRLVQDCLKPLVTDDVDIATLVAEIDEPGERLNPNVVKAVGTPVDVVTGAVQDTGESARRLRTLYFTRATAPTGEGPLYHHIGIYAYRRAALDRFVRLPPAPLERRERLEQLRALENGMRIDAMVVETVPLGVDTPDDLARARQMLTPKR